MSFRPYEDYSDSKIAGLGQVPSHWAAYALKRLCVIRYGIGEPPQYRESGTPLIRATNVDHGRVNPLGLVFVDPADIPEKRVVWLELGDIIVVRSGAYTGDSAIITPEHVPAIAGFDMVLRPTSCEPKFLQYALLSSYLSDAQIGLEKLRAAQPHLNAEELGSCNVILPPRPEQDAIADFLDGETVKIDALVQTQRRLIELLKEKRQAAISQAVTRGLNPSASTIDSGIEGLGEVPAHWSVAPLKRLATIQTGVAKGKDVTGRSTVTVPYVRVANVQAGYLDLDDVAFIELPEDEVERYALRPGDVLMNEGGDYDKLGRGGIWAGQIPNCVHQNHVFAVRPFGISPEWLNTAAAADYARFFFMGRSKQSTNLASISSTNLMELPVPVPPEAEQAEILKRLNATLAQLDQLAEKARDAIDLLQERRAALISAAVTGQIDVRDWTEADVRRAVAAEIIRLHARKPTFGRVKNQKLLYLAEAHAGITEIGGRYERRAAGPYDADLIAVVERDLEATGVMTVSQPDGSGSTVSYSVNRGWKPYNERLKAMLGGRLAAFEQVNAKLADLKTRDAEAVATLYAVWNDALIDGEACDDARVIRGFLDEWHPEKREKFKQAELHTWLGWMRRNGIVPSGRGPRTGFGGLFG